MINIINFIIAQGCELASGLGGGEGTSPGACGQGSSSSLLFIVIMFAIIYFLLLRRRLNLYKKVKR